MATTSSPALIQLSTVLGGRKLLVQSLSASEEMGRLFEFNVSALTEDKALDPSKLLGSHATHPGQALAMMAGWDLATLSRRLPELKAALDRALATRGRFQLIDITIPSGVLSQTLARFVAGVKRLNAPK